jgi:hypothetical protein
VSADPFTAAVTTLGGQPVGDVWHGRPVDQQATEATERQSGGAVFADLEYEPNCLPRHEARKNGLPLPAPCGQCPQELFHAATEFDVLYGGAAGGGKTLALLMDGLRAAVRYPGIRVGLFRRSYPELEESLLAELRPRLGLIQGRLAGAWNEQKHDLKFANGSLLMFRHGKNFAEATTRQGGQYQLLIFDERTLTPPPVVDFLYTRLRSGRADIPVLGVRSGTNPGGIGHGAVKTNYVESTDHGARVIVDNRKRTVRFIPAKLADNPHVNAEYADDLNALPEAMRKAFRDGSWDSFTGQVFTEWQRDRHIVPRFTIPVEWRRLVGIDYGYAAPWAVIWGALDQDGRLWLYRQKYATKVGERDQARQILAAEAGDPPARRAADPAMWAQAGTALPVASAYAIEGVALVKAQNDRLAGWARVHTFLSDGPACAQHRELGWDTCPMLHVLDGTCEDLVRTLPSLPYDPNKVEDVDTNAEDHIADALRYLVMAIGTAPQFIVPSDTPTDALDGRPLLVDRAGIGFPADLTHAPQRKSIYAP